MKYGYDNVNNSYRKFTQRSFTNFKQMFSVLNSKIKMFDVVFQN